MPAASCSPTTAAGPRYRAGGRASDAAPCWPAFSPAWKRRWRSCAPGRRLPSSSRDRSAAQDCRARALGLLFHAAEHAQRHTGQVIVTAKVVRGEGEHPKRRKELSLPPPTLQLSLSCCSSSTLPPDHPPPTQDAALTGEFSPPPPLPLLRSSPPPPPFFPSSPLSLPYLRLSPRPPLFSCSPPRLPPLFTLPPPPPLPLLLSSPPLPLCAAPPPSLLLPTPPPSLRRLDHAHSL